MLDPTRLHPTCRTLFDYWQRIHPADGLPGRQHIEPSDIAALLQHVLLVEFHRDSRRFRYRLLGSQIDSAIGKSLAGQWLDEAYADDPNGAQLLASYHQVVDTGGPVWRRGAPRIVLGTECETIELLRLPLAADGRTVDMVLCMSLYFDAAGRPLEHLFLRRLRN